MPTSLGGAVVALGDSRGPSGQGFRVGGNGQTGRGIFHSRVQCSTTLVEFADEIRSH